MRLRPGNLEAIIRYALGPDAAHSMKLVSTLSGAINDVFRITVGQHDYAVRVRLREHVFRYEKNLLKEAVASSFLASDKTRGIAGKNEEVLDESVDQAVRDRKAPDSNLLPRLLCQDLSRTVVPFPWLLQDWVPGKLIADETHDQYWAAGKALAGLHAFGFPRFRSTFNSPWEDGRDWDARIKGESEQLAAELGICVPWEKLQDGVLEQITGFCLNHNDFQPFNVIASDDRILLIDWDNLQIGPPEFDLVKLKYWTDCDDDGFLRRNPEKFARFVSGYQEEAVRPLNDRVFRFCEVVWLLRVTRFETARTAQGHRPTKPFPGPDHYRNCLKSLFEGTSA